MRLNRFLASAGLGSRRGVEEIITTGQVRVNGKVVTDLSTTVEPGDAIKVGSKLVHAQHTLTAVLNKPRGFLCTAEDEKERRTIFDLLPKNWPRVYHVGRLDKESEGLLIVTNDGDLSLALTHPRYKVDKEYEVLVDKPFVPTDREKLLRGFHIIGGRAKVERVEQLGPQHLRLTLEQGIKRQIRLMLYELGYEVERLVRTRIGPIKIEEMHPGDWRILTSKEISSLRGATLKAPTTAPRRKAPSPRRPKAPGESSAPRVPKAPRDAKPPRDFKAPRDAKPPRDFKGPRDSDAPRRPKAPGAAKAPRDFKGPRDAKGPRDFKAPRDAKAPRDFRGARDSRPPRDSRAPSRKAPRPPRSRD